MKSDEYVFKTRPAYFFLVLMLAVGLFCVWGAYTFWIFSADANTNASETTTLVIRVIFTGVILFFGFTALGLFITFKVCYLTDRQLIISRPLIFFRQVVPRANIRNISEKDSQIDIDRSAFSRDMVKIGETATLLLKNGKKLQISSVNVGGYHELIKKLKHR